MRGTYLWLGQLVSGVLIAGLLGIHIVVQHLNAALGTTDPTAWGPMIARASQGAWMGLYIALLAFGLYHGINGLRGIILESTASVRTGHIVTWVLIVFGIIVFIWGTYVPVALAAS